MTPNLTPCSCLENKGLDLTRVVVRLEGNSRALAGYLGERITWVPTLILDPRDVREGGCHASRL
ncbi:hypothetical protein TthHB5018_c24120 (plasmid) [Thermus thermophilus]|uniref:Uncharacterized protein n=1 Tax=Thermus thermophilus TaxID=274 RepID=A0A7R7YJL2_THETH|nr:hypothetical protein TthHB5018_c24120 [Thermus thermophilus]